ncbi:hypothetical protein M413DRAFT_443663 [Hebeloma cylindrosporum]|uniref:Uncharacterized protein n=1 Tax=Hebeloma cylindrosporum TaxID=76867 RepID=A0A0C3CHZ3_HEBCY|nr:hypothetical protein M413DRAFT_443663 [Hebeloma cylindrosporum h7]
MNAKVSLVMTIDASFHGSVGLGILGDHRNAQRAPCPPIAGDDGEWTHSKSHRALDGYPLDVYVSLDTLFGS